MTTPDEFNLEDIDSISIMAEFGPTRIAIKLGLICTFYVHKQDSTEVRQRLARCGDEYQRLFGKHLKLYRDPSGEGNYKKYPKSGISFAEYLTKNNTLDASFSPTLTGGERCDSASSWNLDIFAPGKPWFPDDDLAYFSATMPFSFLQKQEQKAPFQNLIHAWCKILKPHSGYAGIGAIQGIEMMERVRTSYQVYPLAKRFPGLEVDNPGVVMGHIKNKIKGVNWLTALSDDCLHSLGGRDEFLTKLDSNYHIFEYEGGVLIQAGATPQLGDVNRNHIPQFYKTLSQLTKPIRMTFPEGHPLMQVPGKDNTEISNEWLARFD